MMMRKRSIEQIVDEQVKKWGYATKGRADRKPAISLVTVSREPGSGGKLIAQGIAERLNFDLFHQEVIHEMAQSAKVSTRVVESLDEKGLSMLEDWISAVVHRRHLWPDEYLQHLLKSGQHHRRTRPCSARRPRRQLYPAKRGNSQAQIHRTAGV
jgi:hypothetical protein